MLPLIGDDIRFMAQQQETLVKMSFSRGFIYIILPLIWDDVTFMVQQRETLVKMSFKLTDYCTSSPHRGIIVTELTLVFEAVVDKQRVMGFFDWDQDGLPLPMSTELILLYVLCPVPSRI
jgi:hypothetical protein